MKLLASPAHTSERQSTRAALALARRGWVVGALVLLVNFATGIPSYYHALFITCPPPPSCAAGQLMPGNLQALAQLHLSLQTYAPSTEKEVLSHAPAASTPKLRRAW